MARTVKTIVEDALGLQRAKSLWTANYYPALPFSPQSFDIGSMLPAMLYMARWGHRRGKGRFVATFCSQVEGKVQAPTISDVVTGLVSLPDSALDDFDGEIGRSVLGDLLLAWCLENRKHAEGHKEQVQRIYPTHYLASWIDLPDNISHLRGVPELLTSLLAHQWTGEWLEPGALKSHFPIGVKHAENKLLALFSRYVSIGGPYTSSVASDTFADELATDIGIDELLVVRLAQACRDAPFKAKGKDESERIPNRHPLARRAAEFLREDLAVFIEVYGTSAPRQTFLQMLEAGIALGLTNLLLSTACLLTQWERTGQVQNPDRQTSWPLFVDASQGQDKALRELSEASMVECMRRYERLPVLMMLLRILDYAARYEEDIRKELPPEFPDATERINLLGDVYQSRHAEAVFLLKSFKKDCLQLADMLEMEGEAPEVVRALRDGEHHAALRLAEALCELMGDKPQRAQYMKALESTLMTDRPNGLAIKRRVRQQNETGSRTIDRRAVVLTPPLLDFLVHRHLHKAAKGKPLHPLSLQDFLALLRERYGLYIDREPPGHTVPQELLLRNKDLLEHRLRDLGLLIGVNDAESMKQLRPRYAGETTHAT